MKKIELTDKSIIIDKISAIKIIKVFLTLFAGIASVLLLNYFFAFNFYGSFFENAVLFVLGIIITLCGQSILFGFIKSTSKRLALLCSLISLILGALLCLNYFSAVGNEGVMPGFEDNIMSSLILVCIYHFVYSVVVFGLSMLIVYIFKKIISDRQSVQS